MLSRHTLNIPESYDDGSVGGVAPHGSQQDALSLYYVFGLIYFNIRAGDGELTMIKGVTSLLWRHLCHSYSTGVRKWQR